MICRMCQDSVNGWPMCQRNSWHGLRVSDPGWGWTLSWISIQLPQWSPFQAYHKAIWGIQPLISFNYFETVQLSCNLLQTRALWPYISFMIFYTFRLYESRTKNAKRTSRLDQLQNAQGLPSTRFFSINFPCSCFSSKYRLSGAKFSSTHRSQV